MSQPRLIGAVSYLNTRPLVYGLEDRLPEWKLEFDLPSRLADRFHAGELSVALIPVVELLRGEGYEVLPDACIACDGPVWSVKLVSRVAPSAIRSIALDEGSRTSVCLVRLLMRHFWKVQPVESPLPVTADWTEIDEDAALIIGDRAMRCADAGFPWQWDLGELWREWTGLPFVFAVWAARPDIVTPELVESLAAARDAGLAAAGKIADESCGAYGLTARQCHSYLTEYLRFRLGSRERMGLELFASRVQESGMAGGGRRISYHDGGKHGDCLAEIAAG